jgi:hypothetical protein
MIALHFMESGLDKLLPLCGGRGGVGVQRIFDVPNKVKV